MDQKPLYILYLNDANLFGCLVVDILEYLVCDPMWDNYCCNGAIVSFGLASKFIGKINFNKLHIILIGGLSFLLTDILQISSTYFFDSSVLEHVLRTEKDSLTLYTEVFVFWQVLVGTKLFLSVSNTKLDESEFFKK